LWLTGLADGGVIGVVIGQVLLGGTIALENISLDVEELSCLNKIEQAQRFEEAERQIDEVQRAAPGDPNYQNWVETQRQHLKEVQQLIFEC
jgi:DNA-binding SARP family transcriptional activator